MNLENIIKYAEKLNIKELSYNDRFNGFSGARYRREQWGSRYFKTELIRAGLMFEFNYNNTASNVHEIKKQADALKKYAARYGFAVFFEGYNITGFWFAIMPADDKKQLDIISYFVDESINECDFLIHTYHVCGIHKILNNQLEAALRSIMARWERAYLDYITKHCNITVNNDNIMYFVA